MKDIFTCLQAMFSDPIDRKWWLITPNTHFEDQQPYSLACASPEGLQRVTEYLNRELERGA